MSYYASAAVGQLHNYGQLLPAPSSAPSSSPSAPAFPLPYPQARLSAPSPLPGYGNNFQYRRHSKTLTAYPADPRDHFPSAGLPPAPAPYYFPAPAAYAVPALNSIDRGLPILLIAILVLVALDVVMVRPRKYASDRIN